MCSQRWRFVGRSKFVKGEVWRLDIAGKSLDVVTEPESKAYPEGMSSAVYIHEDVPSLSGAKFLGRYVMDRQVTSSLLRWCEEHFLTPSEQLALSVEDQ